MAGARMRARPRVLLVTPEPVLGVALSQFLAGYFAQVALATSLATAVVMATEGAYAAVVVDADALGAHDGPSLPGDLAALTMLPGLRGRVVVLGSTARTDLARAREVLPKPIPGSELLRAIDACLGPGLAKARPRADAAKRRRPGSVRGRTPQP